MYYGLCIYESDMSVMARPHSFVMPAVEGWINILGNQWQLTDVRRVRGTSGPGHFRFGHRCC